MAPSRGDSERYKKSNACKIQPGKQHARPTRRPVPGAAPSSSFSSPPHTITLPAQQQLLDTFTSAFPNLLDPNTISTTLTPTLQEVKGHLYNRDFATAFSHAEYLEAYAARWSPSRALAYLEIFADLLAKHLPRSDGNEDPTGDYTEGHKGDDVKNALSLRIACLGGGAGAEVVALSALHYSRPFTLLQVDAIDIANWSSVLSALAPSSATATASFTTTFTQADLLEPPCASIVSILRNAKLLTLLFTLNELYTSSLGRTQTFLLDLTRHVHPGTLLLVVDSPGSYASVKIAGKEKAYPMRWLLDHTLLKVAGEVQDIQGRSSGDGKGKETKWEKIEEHESKWFRVPEGLRYPIELENMRYQMHLFRRV